MNAKENATQPKKRKGKGCLTVLAILAVVLLLLGVAAGIGWTFLEKEHRETRNLSFQVVDFSRLNDGVWHGAYAGGMYKWRYNECDVTVSNGKVVEINLTHAENVEALKEGAEMLYDRIIQEQSLQVDAISGSTLTSNGYLKCVESAVVLALQN